MALKIIQLYGIFVFINALPCVMFMVVYYTSSEGSQSPRTELLHNIDPLYNPVGNLHPNSKFDNRIRAAIRVGDYKLVTGYPGTCIIITITV